MPQVTPNSAQLYGGQLDPPKHRLSPGAHDVAHAPSEQTSASSQTWPHAPQLSGSSCSLTHESAHSSRPGGHGGAASRVASAPPVSRVAASRTPAASLLASSRPASGLATASGRAASGWPASGPRLASMVASARPASAFASPASPLRLDPDSAPDPVVPSRTIASRPMSPSRPPVTPCV